MMKLRYAGGEIYISDLASTVLLRYAQILAEHSASDTVVLPAVTMEGAVGDTHILIGPASELLVVPTNETPTDIDDREALAVMRERAARMQPHRPMVDGSAGDSGYDDDYGIG
jgi:hypothetical protein